MATDIIERWKASAW